MEELEEEAMEGLVRVAKAKVENKNFVEAFKYFREKNDHAAILMLGLIVGLAHGLNQTLFGIRTVHNFNVCLIKLRRGESEEKIAKELKAAHKEAKYFDQMMYGG